MIDRTVAHYRILERLGEGGMGVVYKAEDTRLHRTVALKFLSADVTGSGEFEERFLREARASAALDHPNICTIHEIGQEAGETFLAMAYLEGVPLDEKIQDGPLPLEAVYSIAKQAAEGLAAAHGRGIVHRDIKSSNIMISEDRAGRPVVKLMDFGLAQVSGASKLTQVGVRMGTTAYMSPEQASGEDVAAGSDLWSLGVVIYEMVTGELPFKGHYDQAIIYSLLNEDPAPLTALRSRVPMELEWIVEKCLAKSVAERYQDAHDLVVDLEMLVRRATSGRTVIKQAEPVPEPEPETQPGPPGTSRSARPDPPAKTRSWIGPRYVAAVAALVAVAFAAGLALPFGDGADSAPTRRFTLRPIEAVEGSQRIRRLAISPDGRNVAFSTTGLGGSLWLQPLDRHAPVRLDGTAGAREVFWSPSSDYVGFTNDRGIGRVALRGLTAEIVEETTLPVLRAAWTSDGQSIVYASVNGQFMAVSARGGEARSLGGLVGRRRASMDSMTLVGVKGGPDILLYSIETPDDFAVVARPIEDGALGEPVRLREGTSPLYSETGHLLYRPPDVSSYLAVAFSPEDLEITGEPFLVAQDVFNPSVSADGTLVFTDNPFAGQSRLQWLDSGGSQVRQLGKEQNSILGPRVSPDRSKVLVSAGDERSMDLWVHEVDRPVLSRLTFEDSAGTTAVWSPDSRRVAFSWFSSNDLKVLTLDGAVPVQTIHSRADRGIRPLDWSRDGRHILAQLRFRAGGLGRGLGRSGAGSAVPKKAAGGQGLPSTEIIYLESVEGEWVAREFVPQGQILVNEAVFSPDGRFVAYDRAEPSDTEVYVRSFPDGIQRWQVTTAGGAFPRWSEDGKELYYTRDDTLFAVMVDTTSGFEIGEERRLFSHDSLALRHLGQRPFPTYDVGPDGLFAIVGPAQNPEPPALRLVLNWLSDSQAP